MARTHLFLIILPLLLVALPSIAAESWCVIPSSGDWTCLNESAYTSGTGTFNCTGANAPFSQCCTVTLGGDYLTVPDDRCIQNCCCNPGPPKAAYESAPISRQRCALYGANAQFSPVAEDCTAACTNSGPGNTGTSHTVTGMVYDIQNSSSPQPLDSARIEYPFGSVIRTTYTQNGLFTLVVPEGMVTFKVSKTNCGVNQTTMDITTNTTMNFNLNCATGNCATTAVNDTKATPIQGTPQVTITWTPTTCTNAQGYTIYRCQGTPDSCTGDTAVGYAGPTENSVIDANAPPNTGLCYKVKAVNASGDEIDQDLPSGYNLHCILPMNQYCLSNHPAGPACFNNDQNLNPVDANGTIIASFTGAAHCDANNRVQIDQTCDGGTICYYTATSTTSCRAPDDCQKCNGLFGFFVDLAAKVTGGASCSQLAGCFLDNKGYATDTFRSCDEIAACAGYHTKTACEADRCHAVQNGCNWTDLAPELGKGACVPKSGEPECSECDVAFGGCDAARCAAMGQCYYLPPGASNIDGAPEGCVGKKEMACRLYVTKQDCVGNGQNVQVDVTYNHQAVDGQRTGGTNAIVKSSADVLGLGVCAWIDAPGTPGGGYCVKNANGWLPQLPWLDNKQEDDCLETEGASFPAGVGLIGCLRDTIPPVTKLPFKAGDYIDADRLRAATPIVTDNTFPPDEMKTYLCLGSVTGQPCYPNKPIDDLVPVTLGVGIYTVYYYSVDPSGNLEPVQNISLSIDQDSNAHLVEATLVR